MAFQYNDPQSAIIMDGGTITLGKNNEKRGEKI
jgi:hypothetical protein